MTDKNMLTWPDILFWLLPLTILVLLLIAWAGWRYYFAPAKRINRRLSKLASDFLHDVVIPDGMDGHIHLDYLLLTANSILVAEVNDVPGIIFAGDRLAQWTVLNGSRRHSFRNPLDGLANRVAAVRALAGAAQVDGCILFTDNGSFPKGAPAHVMRLEELEESVARGEPSAAVVQAWQSIKDRLQV